MVAVATASTTAGSSRTRRRTRCFRDFAETMIRLRGERLRFPERPYIDKLYSCLSRNIVIRASRQVEKSTYLANRIVYELVTRPGIRILFVSPRAEQTQSFITSRLHPTIVDSPLIRQALGLRKNARLKQKHLQFPNGSEVYARAAFHSGDATRGISADILICDEYQDLADGDLPVLQETLSHARRPITILTGTPKLVTNHLEAAFCQSTANQWTIRCEHCNHACVPDLGVIGSAGLICSQCRELLDVQSGCWMASNPTSTWGEGFWINHLMAPWVDHTSILQRQLDYDESRFKNEVLGLSTAVGELALTRDQLLACAVDRPQPATATDIPAGERQLLVAGVDWGGAGGSHTAIAIGSIKPGDPLFTIWCWKTYPKLQEPREASRAVAALCRAFGVRVIAADGMGSGRVANSMLLEDLAADNPGITTGGQRILYGICYGSQDGSPTADGLVEQLTIGRSKWIGGLFSRVKLGHCRIPREADCPEAYSQILAEYADYDSVTRTIRYRHPESQPDDMLHASTYALVAASRLATAATADPEMTTFSGTAPTRLATAAPAAGLQRESDRVVTPDPWDLDDGFSGQFFGGP